jgi:hypothetical protein
VVWFGARSFWGHLRHLIASAIATDSIDSRDWMTPDDPNTLTARITALLGGNISATSLIDALGRDLYVDFVADTGDDVAVSRAVARLVFAPYELPDPDRPGEFLLAPRGEILVFGGDTAYPVATAQELASRVIAPWNQVLQELPDDGRRRVLLGVPGNHDWYDGLDGFARMFRRRVSPMGEGTDIEMAAMMTIEHHLEWAREFVRGGKLEKPEAFLLLGYTAVQNASYFALPLAQKIQLLAVDRQLTTTDSRQTRFLRDYYEARPDAAAFVLLPDPVYAFGEASKTGADVVENLHLDFETRETFVLTGDIHHYERLEKAKLLHVISGGGGAFLHPARIASGGLSSAVVWPGIPQCRKLLWQVPWKLACGRSGYLPHYGLLLVFALAWVLNRWLFKYTGLVISASILTTLFISGIYSVIGGVTERPKVFLYSFVAALTTVLLPIPGILLLKRGLETLGWSTSVIVAGLAGLAVGVFLEALVFGCFLALLTLLGYENMQAFTVLDHPGFKQFVRLRVRADGSGIDGWCIGAADPLRDGEKPVLVDCFKWRPFRQ